MRHWCLLAVAAISAHADVTLRYRIDSTPAAILPPGIDQSPSLRMKGTKGSTTLGRLKVIIDVTKGEVTIVDEEQKAFAAFPAAEYGAKVAAAAGAAPAAENPPAMPKMDFRTRKSGRAAKILDIDAEETEASMQMQLEQFGVSMSMRIWTPKPSEVLRIPALREASAANLWLEHFIKVRDEFDLPGVEGLPLRLDMEVRITGQSIPGVDPSAPVFQMKMEAIELSTAPLDDALFRVPEGFAARAPEELLKHQSAPPSPPEPPGAVQAFVPGMDPVEAKHRDYPAEAGGAAGAVRLLVTVAPDGKVLNAEPVGGPEALRKFAVAEVESYRYRPVLRGGKPVTAMTDHTVFFLPPGSNAVPAFDMAGDMAAPQRILALEKQFPRTPQLVLADLEQDRGEKRRVFYAAELARAALDAGDLAKAEAYAGEALAETSDDNDGWNRGNRVHYGHIVLGRVALRRDDVVRARERLLAAGKTPGSPQLNSFGPDFSLARELLAKGETAAVLDYLEECRVFWKLGGARLDQWKEEIRAGRKPAF